MSLTAWIFLTVYVTGLVLTLRYPFMGVATYIFEWHNHPPYMWWGTSLPELRWSLIVGAVTIVGLVLNYKKLPQLKNSNYKLILWLLGLTVWSFVVSEFWSIDRAKSFEISEFFLKITVETFLMMYLIRSLWQYKVIIWVFILNVVNFGKIAFERGSNRYLGVLAPTAGEENAVAIHVTSMVPFLGLYFLTGNKWEKIVTFLGLPLLINLIVLANSRASFFALIVVGILTFLWAKGRLRWRVSFALIAAFILVSVLANQTFWERQKSVLNYKKEASAASRWYLWDGAWRMAKDYPMGVGGEGFEALAVEYVPELAESMQDGKAKTVHNTFLLALVEWGVVGLLLFVGFLSHAFVILYRIQRDSKRTPNFRYYVESLCIQFALIAILTAGLFHNRLICETVYWFVAFGVALRNMQVHEMATAEEEVEVKDSVAVYEAGKVATIGAACRSW